MMLWKLILIDFLLFLRVTCESDVNRSDEAGTVTVCTKEDEQQPTVIRLLGDPILSTPCRQLSVQEINGNMVQSAISVGHKELAEFRARNGFGRAIAAPQFGYSIQLICLFLDQREIAMINPLITYRSPETFLMWDDCLSFPHLMAAVERHKSISVSFIDDKGNQQEWKNLPQDVSELLQHEIDHLAGVLAVDIAVDPVNGECAERECSGIVARSEWLQNRDIFDSYIGKSPV